MSGQGMIFVLFVIVFFTVVVTGPAGVEWQEKRRALRDRPMAKVLYLPTASCQTRSLSALTEEVVSKQTREADALELRRIEHRRAGCAMHTHCGWCDDPI